MNRTIKFRGKSADNRKWITGYYYHECGNTYIVEDRQSLSETSRNVPCVVIPETVGQFTGLFDKNGKEIYEGDILNNGQCNYFVCWNSERGAWWLKNKDLIYTTPLGFLSIELFVVGNIHDNPELLKGGKE